MSWEFDVNEANDDRAERQQTDIDLPDSGLGDDLREFLAKPVPDKPTRSRNLLPTFRAVPGISGGDSSSGFPGARVFALSRSASAPSPYRFDPGEAGRNRESARQRLDHASEVAPGSNDFARRGAAVLAAGSGAASDRPTKPADKGAAGGNVRRRGRPPGSGKKGQVKTYLPKAIAKLLPEDAINAPHASPKIIPTESERANATRLFRQIGETFNENRKKSKTAAYAAYRHDLMANLDTLIMGGAIDLKEVTTVITNLEQYTKETEAESTETPATILGRWLRMGPEEVAGLSVPVEESVEDEEIDEELAEEVN